MDSGSASGQLKCWWNRERPKAGRAREIPDLKAGASPATPSHFFLDKECRVWYIGDGGEEMLIHKDVTKEKEEMAFALFLTGSELAVMTNALEDATVNWAEGSDIQLKAEDLVMTITKIIGP